MKKITLVLAAAVTMFGTAFAQPVVTVKAPPSNNASTQVRAPNGNVSHAFMKGMFLIPQSELSQLSNLTAGTATAFGFDLLQGVTTPGPTGQFTVYLQNTGDATYSKGTDFALATSTMPVHYTGGMTIPVTTGTAAIDLALTSNFVYGGGGIYVAYTWTCSGPFSSGFATYDANNAIANSCATSDASITAAPNTLTLTNFRPVCRFRAANTASLQLEVQNMTAVGKVSKLAGTQQTITALVKNSSIGALTNVPVTLSITGATPYSSVQTISSIAAGSSTLLTFVGYIANASGTNNMTVSVGPDQYNSDNQQTWTQLVNCNTYAITAPLTAGSYTGSGYGAGANTAGIIYAFKYTSGATSSSLTGVNCVVPSFANAMNSGKQLYPVLCDASGNVVASGNTVTIGTAMMDVFFNYPFANPPALTPNTSYYIGLGIPTNSYFPIGQVGFAINGFYQIPTGGGAPTAINYGYLSLEATLGFSNTIISASATRTRVCNKSNETTTLTVAGMSGLTYSWTGSSQTGTSIVVTPSLTGASGAINYTVTGNDGVSGCASNKAVVTISVQNCTSIETNGDFAASVKVFPNPAVNGKVTVKGLDGANTITVFNVLGQAVLNLNTNDEEVLVDLNNQPTGNYLLKISSGNQSRTIKILKN